MTLVKQNMDNEIDQIRESILSAFEKSSSNV